MSTIRFERRESTAQLCIDAKESVRGRRWRAASEMGGFRIAGRRIDRHLHRVGFSRDL